MQKWVFWNPCFKTDCRDIYFLPKPKTWVGLNEVNARAVKNAVQLHENVVQNYIVIG